MQLKNKMTGIIAGTLKYKEGDATLPAAGGHRILIHICNDKGAFGAGFVVPLTKRWPRIKEEYRRWYFGQRDFKLGNIQEVNLKSDFTIINMIAQHDIKPDKDGNPPIRYDALGECLKKVAKLAKESGGTVHGPRFGSGLSGGSWPEIEQLIIKHLINQGVNVTIYDLPKKEDNV